MAAVLAAGCLTPAADTAPVPLEAGGYALVSLRAYDSEGNLLANESALPVHVGGGSPEDAPGRWGLAWAVPRGLEAALVGATPGESVDVTLPPRLAYGEYDPGQVREMNRTERYPAEFTAPRGFVAARHPNATVGDVVEVQWRLSHLPARIVAEENGTLRLRWDFPGERRVSQVHWPATARLEGDWLVHRHDPEENATYLVSMNRFARVRQVTDDTITVDDNPPFAGETLRFEATVLEVRPPADPAHATAPAGNWDLWVPPFG